MLGWNLPLDWELLYINRARLSSKSHWFLNSAGLHQSTGRALVKAYGTHAGPTKLPGEGASAVTMW